MGMTLDQQLTEIIATARRQITAQFDERMTSLAAEFGQAASSDRTAAIRDLRLAAEAEIAKRSQEAVAATQVEAARRLDEAVAATQTEAARRTQEAVAAAEAEAARRLHETVAAAEAEAARRLHETVAAAEAEAARRTQEAVAAAEAEAARRLHETVAATQAEAGRRFDEAVAATQAEAARRTQEAVAAAEAEAARRLLETVAATQTEAARRTQEAVAATESEAARGLHEAVAATQAEAGRRLDETVAAVRADLAQRVEEAVAAVRAEADQRMAAAVAAARREAEETARQTAAQALVESQVAARQSELAQIDRVVEAARRFDQARSLTEVLDALGDVTSREAPRVALFLVRGNRLAGWRATGFGPAVDPLTIEVVSDESSLLWRAIASGQSLSTTDSAPGERLTTPFGELGHDAAGLAVPVRVGGETVAVIYADDAADGPRVVPSAWPEVVEVMARHAARCLEVLTMSRAVPPTATAPPPPAAPRVTPPEISAPTPRTEADDSARRYARLLVSEIKLYHEAAVTEGRHGHNLADRLRSEIDRARKLYEERVPIEIRNRADHFGQELVRTLANGDPALLGASPT